MCYVSFSLSRNTCTCTKKCLQLLPTVPREGLASMMDPTMHEHKQYIPKPCITQSVLSTSYVIENNFFGGHIFYYSYS